MDTKTLLKSQYKIIRELGQGGFGKTYLAEDKNQKRCVIKEFAPAQGNDSEQATQLFRQEAERLKEVGQHPQIPKFYDYFEEDNKLFLAQEYIAGDSLQELLQKGQRFTEEEIENLLRGTLPLLRYLHNSNVIHRDIKPANIIRRQSDGALVLVDFGAAKRVSETVLAKTGTMIGSVGYASNEQIRGRTTFASDIYSLGMTCVVMLTGTSPMNIVTDPMTGTLKWRLEIAGKTVREEFAAVLDKMIDDIQGRRYQSADATLQAIKAAEQAEIDKRKAKVLARAERKQSLARWGKRSAAAMLGAAIIGGIGYGVFTQRGAIKSWLTITPKNSVHFIDLLSIGLQGSALLLVVASARRLHAKMSSGETENMSDVIAPVMMSLFVAISSNYIPEIAATTFSETSNGHEPIPVLPVLRD